MLNLMKRNRENILPIGLFGKMYKRSEKKKDKQTEKVKKEQKKEKKNNG